VARVQGGCRQAGEYLLIEDTTALDFTGHWATEDLGRIGDDGGQGLFHQQWWARPGAHSRAW